ncbi:MAG: hypothetical protein COV29_02895 [Candidatus Yanofskybacteria bacterium CG10_big_fil_rev_8_21_14_0_10_36_16]|uniref:Uncharacterized protein n=1 Tax=Candidatus Yanofskybacteria bacterium CG10_big_fil_rev_8_21_14_0_10_36_16 TaxID=1975096 RepID=A0A2J0Q6T3_9BACT|nr:MAG: hypothetical protein COV29_02895 [Candidatus Yanofskybacteria bacterium CG10_big_fil_rev_8_21_14_0_10_36_16]
MLAAQRTAKQLTILAVFLIIVGGISFTSYRIVSPPQPTPTPPPEAGLEPVKVLSTRVFSVRDNDYDFMALVKNPNQTHGSREVDYVLNFIGPDGEVVKSIPGKFYILPGQTRYVIESPLVIDKPFVTHEFKITDVVWNKLNILASAEIDLVVLNADYSEVNSGGLFSRVEGVSTNNSDFDLSDAEIVIVVLNSVGEPIAVNKTSISTFLSRTNRSFEVRWPSPFIGNFNRLDVGIYTNVFENTNFLRRVGGQERFQEFNGE